MFKYLYMYIKMLLEWLVSYDFKWTMYTFFDCVGPSFTGF